MSSCWIWREDTTMSSIVPLESSQWSLYRSTPYSFPLVIGCQCFPDTTLFFHDGVAYWCSVEWQDEKPGSNPGNYSSLPWVATLLDVHMSFPAESSGWTFWAHFNSQFEVQEQKLVREWFKRGFESLSFTEYTHSWSNCLILLQILNILLTFDFTDKKLHIFTKSQKQHETVSQVDII